jgi:hypothetical protein
MGNLRCLWSFGQSAQLSQLHELDLANGVVHRGLARKLREMRIMIALEVRDGAVK